MRHAGTQRRSLVWALAFCPIWAAAQPAISEKLLTPAEIAGIERENEMWRLLRAEEEVPRNLAILREAGFAEEEIKRLEPRMTEWWTIPFERHFGWLSFETVERIQEIDRTYTARMRAARVRAETGIQIMAPYLSSPRQVSAQWHMAILTALDYNEIAEFRLMNSPSARKVDVLTKDIALTEAERRQLNEWQREFDAEYGRGTGGANSQEDNRRWRQETQLDFHRRVRDLLGDQRFATYLAATNSSFRRLRDILQGAGVTEASAGLDAWWIRQRYQVLRARENRWSELDELAGAERAELTTLFGAEAFARYVADKEESRWLYPQRIVVQRSAPSAMRVRALGTPARASPP
jgi:hypothetical protein